MPRFLPCFLLPLAACLDPVKDTGDLPADDSAVSTDDTSGETGETDDTREPSDDVDTGTQTVDPDLVTVSVELGWDEGALVAVHPYATTAEGAAVEPTLRLHFTRSDLSSTGGCDWVGVLTTQGSDTLSLEEVWTGWEASLTTQSTNCSGFDEAMWGDTTPSALLEGRRVGLGLGALAAAHHMQLGLDEEGQHEGRDPDEIASRHVGVYLATREGSGALEGVPVVAEPLLQVDADHSLSVNADGVFIPLTVEEGALPERFYLPETVGEPVPVSTLFP